MKKLIIILLLLFISLPCSAEINRREILQLTNQERIKNGSQPLKENSLLNKSAKMKASDILKNNRFEHTDLSWFLKAGYNYENAGENLAMDVESAERLFKEWKKSISHYENMLREDYEDIGIAVLAGNLEGENRVIIVQHFGEVKKPKVEEKPIQKITKPAIIEKPIKPVEIVKEPFESPIIPVWAKFIWFLTCL